MAGNTNIYPLKFHFPIMLLKGNYTKEDIDLYSGSGVSVLRKYFNIEMNKSYTLNDILIHEQVNIAPKEMKPWCVRLKCKHVPNDKLQKMVDAVERAEKDTGIIVFDYKTGTCCSISLSYICNLDKEGDKKTRRLVECFQELERIISSG